MRLTTVTQILALPDGSQVEYTRGKCVFVGEYYEGTSARGPWTLQTITLADDATKHIKCKLVNRDKVALNWTKKLVHVLAGPHHPLMWRESVNKKTGTKSMELEVTPSAEVGLDEPGNGGAAKVNPPNDPPPKLAGREPESATGAEGGDFWPPAEDETETQAQPANGVGATAVGSDNDGALETEPEKVASQAKSAQSGKMQGSKPQPTYPPDDPRAPTAEAERRAKRTRDAEDLPPSQTAAAMLPARIEDTQPIPMLDSAQARISSVAALLHKGYERASTLALTEEEKKTLTAKFPDEAFRTGAAGKENLIYIQHALLRDRLNEAIGIGQWLLVVRNRWKEDFTYWHETNKREQTAHRVYVDGALLIRGILVGESIGDMVYYPSNPAVNFGDAAEGAKSEALRRCLKDLGVGSQAWDKTFCEAWFKRRNKALREAAEAERAQNRQKPTPTEPAKPASAKQTATAPTKKAPSVEKCREHMVKLLWPIQKLAKEYGVQKGYLHPQDTLMDWPEKHVPRTKEEMDKLAADIDAFGGGQ